MTLVPGLIAGSVSEEAVPYLREGYEGYWMRFTATPNEGYVFDHYEWTEYRKEWNSHRGEWVTTSQLVSSYLNPTVDAPKNARVFNPSDPTDRGVTLYYENPIAYFRWVGPGPGPGPEPGTKHTVSIVADPESGGIVSGGGEYDDGASCTLTAKRNIGFELMRLVNSANGITIYPPNPPQCFGKTITHTFTVRKDSSWVAYFRECTNAILRGHSGNILRGNGGNVLIDW